MDEERGPAIFHKLQGLAGKFRDKIYRHGYVASHTRGVLAQQMRNFRDGLSQAEFAAALGKQKTVIGRLENPAYSGWSLSTMLEVARKRDVAVFCRFVDFPTFLRLSNDLSDAALCPPAYNEKEFEEPKREPVPLDIGKVIKESNWRVISLHEKDGNIEVTTRREQLKMEPITANDDYRIEQIMMEQTNVR